MGLFTGEPPKSKTHYELMFKCRCCLNRNTVVTDAPLTLPYETYLKNYVSKFINDATLQHCKTCNKINVADLITVTQPVKDKSIFDGANKKEKQILAEHDIDEDYFKSEKHKSKTVSTADQLFIKKS